MAYSGSRKGGPLKKLTKRGYGQRRRHTSSGRSAMGRRTNDKAFTLHIADGPTFITGY